MMSIFQFDHLRNMLSVLKKQSCLLFTKVTKLVLFDKFCKIIDNSSNFSHVWKNLVFSVFRRIYLSADSKTGLHFLSLATCFFSWSFFISHITGNLLSFFFTYTKRIPKFVYLFCENYKKTHENNEKTI